MFNEFVQEPKMLKKGLGYFSRSFTPENLCLAFYCFGKMKFPCHLIISPDQNEIIARFKYREQVEQVIRNGHGKQTSPISVVFYWKDFEKENDFLLFTRVQFPPIHFLNLRDNELRSYYNITVSSDAIWSACAINPSLDEQVSKQDYDTVTMTALTIAMAHDIIVERIDYQNHAIEFYGDSEKIEMLCNNILLNGYSVGYEKMQNDTWTLYMKRGV